MLFPSENADYSEEIEEMVRRDERKFEAADADQNGKLDFEEFKAFRHPEIHEHMQQIVTLVCDVFKISKLFSQEKNCKKKY